MRAFGDEAPGEYGIAHTVCVEQVVATPTPGCRGEGSDVCIDGRALDRHEHMIMRRPLRDEAWITGKVRAWKATRPL